MSFGLMLESRLKGIERFKGISCSAEVSTDEFQGCILHGVYRGKEQFEISAGFKVKDGTIIGYGYYADGSFYGKSYVTPKFLDGINEALDDLATDIIEDEMIGSKEWLTFRFQTAVPALVDSVEVLRNENTGNKIFILESVLADFGFAKSFAALVFGYSTERQMYVISLASQYYVDPSHRWFVLRSEYEAVFQEAAAGNELYRKVKRSAFKSKKGNIIYKMNKDDLTKDFHRVHGEKIKIERR